jgi:F1F0 ATPase subunit 2
MTDVSTLALGLVAGSALGAVFYGGLWWTVLRVSGRAVGPWLVGSFLLRTLIVLAGFFAVARGPWHGVAACFAGFLAARLAVTRFTRSSHAARSGTPS